MTAKEVIDELQRLIKINKTNTIKGINENAEVVVNGQSIAQIDHYEENRVEIYLQ